MYDLECPYCGKEQNVDHDDGNGYSEDEIHQQKCIECKKTFVFTTGIIYVYSPEKADCLNGGMHKWKSSSTFPKEASRMFCEYCGEERQPTKAEWEDILAH